MDFQTALDAEIARIEAELQQDPRAVKLRELTRLRALYASAQPQHPFAARTAAPPTVVPEGLDRKRRETSPSRAAAIEASRSFLKGRKEPTKTAEIFEHLELNEIQIGGTEPKSNLSALLYHSPYFRSHGRAGWTLKENEAPLGKPNGASARLSAISGWEGADLMAQDITTRGIGRE